MQAQASLLLSQEKADRLRLLVHMDDADIAAVVCAMDPAARTGCLEELAAEDAALATNTVDAIW